MKPSTKPRTPKKVYKYSVLYYTVVDYIWIDPNSKECKHGLLKSGWFPLKVFNYEHPLTKASLKKTKEASEQCLKNKEVNWFKLDEIVINI